jgi:hypothetical protein
MRSSIRRVVDNSASRSGKSRAIGLCVLGPAADLFAGFRTDLFADLLAEFLADFLADLVDDFRGDLRDAFDDFERAAFLAMIDFK